MREKGKSRVRQSGREKVLEEGKAKKTPATPNETIQKGWTRPAENPERRQKRAAGETKPKTEKSARVSVNGTGLRSCARPSRASANGCPERLGLSQARKRSPLFKKEIERRTRCSDNGKQASE